MKRFVSLFIFLLFLGMPAYADSVLLKNGRKIQGIVVSETGDPEIVLEVGSGKVILAPDEVAVVTRSDSDQQQLIRDDWQKRQLEAEAAFQLGLTQERLRSTEATKLEALKPKQASLATVNGHLYVDAAINDRPPSRLLLDTGAPYIVLTRQTAEAHGVDFARKWPLATASIGGHKIPCLLVTLDKVEVEGFWSRDVEALVYTIEGDDWVYNQNILGMSYLQQFHFEINVKKSLLTLSWGETS